jgi:hypothetical protein
MRWGSAAKIASDVARRCPLVWNHVHDSISVMDCLRPAPMGLSGRRYGPVDAIVMASLLRLNSVLTSLNLRGVLGACDY